MFNLNYSHQPEYDLYNSLTHELITGYGVLVKYITTEKVNLDHNTFGEWTTLKADQDDIYEVHLLPDTPENWQGQNIMFDQFGLGNFSTMDFFISERELHSIFPDLEDSYNVNDMISDLIIVPSGKVLEVTHVEPLTEGVNNLFIYDDRKNSIKITCRNYIFREADEIKLEPDVILTPADETLTEVERKAQENLDTYFTKLIDTDSIPDEKYVPRAGKIDIIDYRMIISDTLFTVDSLTINGIDAGTTPIQTASESSIIETASSDKLKQDIISSTPVKAEVTRVKEDEFSNPFGELG